MPPSPADIRAKWIPIIEKLDLKAPRDQGMLWSKIEAKSAKAIAQEGGRVTLEILLEREGVLKPLEKDLEPYPRDHPVSQEIWYLLSQKFARNLTGRVSAVVHQGRFINNSKTMSAPGGDGTYTSNMGVEIDELEELMAQNVDVSLVAVYQIDGQTGGPALVGLLTPETSRRARKSG